jgi:transposase-like protein
MHLHLLMFSLFSIIGSIQGGESYDFNPGVFYFDNGSIFFDFSTDRPTGANDEDQGSFTEQGQMVDSPLGDGSACVEAEIDTPVDTSGKREHGRRHDPKLRKEVLEFCKKNKASDACKKFDLPSSTVSRWCRDEERKESDKKFTEEIKAEALKLYSDGEPVKNICRTLGVPAKKLTEWRVEAKIVPRSKNHKRNREAFCEDSDTSIKKDVKQKRYDEALKVKMRKLYFDEKLKDKKMSLAEFRRQHCNHIPSRTFGDWIK